MDKNYVWEFTNQKKLFKGEFIDYVERKVFRTIRKFNLFSGSVIKLKKENSLNYNVLKHILGKKFSVESNRGGLTSDNLSSVSEKIFSNILKGNFDKKEKIISPLYFISDEEIELYAKLVGIKGKARKKDKKVQELFKKFIGKNKDLEHNIVNAFEQL